MYSFPPASHTATPPRGDHGAECFCQFTPSLDTQRAFEKSPSLRFAPISHILPSNTTGVPVHFPGDRVSTLLHVTPSADDHISLSELGLGSRSPSITLPPMIQSLFLNVI